MRREDLTAKLSGFDGKADVHDWTWHGWHPWPLLRTRLLLALHGEPAVPAEKPKFGARARAALDWRRRQRHRRSRYARQKRGPEAKADVVFLSNANRSERLGTTDYNTVVDPWNEALTAGGHVVSVWNLGDPVARPLPGHVTIQAALDEIRRQPEPPVEPAPAWFLGLADFVADELDSELSWREVWRDLCLVEAYAQRFGEWLAAAQPRSLVVDCWYLCEMLGATLAAHRQGIPVIDLQHGIQGHAHPAYAGWNRPPEGGYETFPDRFWVWGDWDAQSLRDHNPGAFTENDVRVVGNPWIADWSTLVPRRGGEEAREATPPPGISRTVLVTLQKGVPFRDSLVELVRASPTDWHWWIRLHRNMRERAPQLEQELRSATGRPVEVERATELPLYALLRNSSWHVTAFSTCALEAMAFGVPTLLTDASGSHAYAEFVAQGAMHAPEDLEARVALLARDPERFAETCRRGARRVFAGPDWRALSEVLAPAADRPPATKDASS
ncbi:MAG: glycosyltransferase [Myxococcota bacterium]